MSKFISTKLTIIFLLSLASVTGCGYLRIDPMSPYLRSAIVTSPEIEQQIVSKGRLEWSADGRVRVLYVQGTPYERGYQHGYLLRKEIQDNIVYLWEQATKKYHSEELFLEAYERQRPYIPQEFIDEMHGLAHGSKVPLHIIHAIHALPEVTEWGGKRQLKETVQKMMAGEIGTSCSNLATQGKATADGSMYVVRILDWGLHRISKLHKYPLITVTKPESGHVAANIGWVGFLGAVSGMNERGITLGEMGYGDPPGETMSGKPMVFMLREILQQADSLADVRRIISTSKGTNSFVYLMSDGKTRDAEMYMRNKDRFLVFQEGQDIDADGRKVPAISQTVYGGHKTELMTTELQSSFGKVDAELLMKDLIPKFAMKSNFQNVVYDPVKLRFWVSNARSKELRAAEQPYTFFDLRAAAESFPK
jgi:isopenicillin-N N-acyltransferase-like protein